MIRGTQTRSNINNIKCRLVGERKTTLFTDFRSEWVSSTERHDKKTSFGCKGRISESCFCGEWNAIFLEVWKQYKHKHSRLAALKWWHIEDVKCKLYSCCNRIMNQWNKRYVDYCKRNRIDSILSRIDMLQIFPWSSK